MIDQDLPSPVCTQPSRATRFVLSGPAVLLASLVLGSAVHAQAELLRIEATSSARLGQHVCAPGDLNGDGFDDVLVGAPAALGFDRVQAYSGLDGSLLYGVQGPDTGVSELGTPVCGAGDVNNDGFADFIVGFRSVGNGQVVVHSGQDGSVLHFLLSDSIAPGLDDFGASVGGAGDINGDGHDDFLVAAPGINAVGSVFVLSGLDASVLYRFDGPPQSRFGFSVSGGEDLNGDAVPDVIVGAPFQSNNSNPGAVLVYSGADGSSLHVIPGIQQFEDFGASVSHAGDVNDDGFGDFIVGASLHDGLGNSTGRAQVFSGTDGSTLFEISAQLELSSLGFEVSAAGDVNGDGFDDVMTLSASTVRVHSGLGGALLHTFSANPPSAAFGRALASAGDFNSDGFDDILIGDSLGGATGDGAAIVFAGAMDIAPRYPDLCNGDGGDQVGCVDCPCGNNATQGTIGGCLNSSGRAAHIVARGDSSLSLPSDTATDLEFSLHHAPVGALCVLVSGDAIAPMDMAHPCNGTNSGVRSPLFDGLRCAILNLRRHGSRSSSPTGSVHGPSAWGGFGPPSVGLAAQDGSFVVGQTRYFQVVFRDFSDQVCMRGLNTSQAVGVTFQP